MAAAYRMAAGKRRRRREDEDEDEDEVDVGEDEVDAVDVARAHRPTRVKHEDEDDDDDDDEDAADDGEVDVVGDDDDDDDEDGELNVTGAQPRQRGQNHPELLLQHVAELRGADGSIPWIETLEIVAPAPTVVPNVDDDFQRELAFYKQALEAAVVGKRRVLETGVKFDRPDDYFAEMLKTDAHMQKVRQRIADEAQQIKRSEEVAKQRAMRKYGKQVQAEKQQERAKQKSKQLEKLKMVRKGRANVDKALEDDDFEINVEDSEPPSPAPSAGAGGKSPKSKGGRKPFKPFKSGGAPAANGGKKKEFGFAGKKQHGRPGAGGDSGGGGGGSGGGSSAGMAGKKRGPPKGKRPGKFARQRKAQQGKRR